MKIKIIRHVPTKPSPVVGQEYEVIRVQDREVGGKVYFVEHEGQEVGVLAHEMKIVER